MVPGLIRLALSRNVVPFSSIFALSSSVSADHGAALAGITSRIFGLIFITHERSRTRFWQRPCGFPAFCRDVHARFPGLSHSAISLVMPWI
jgi:hypothetical protein